MFATRIALTLLLLVKTMNCFTDSCWKREKNPLCLQDCGLSVLFQCNLSFRSFSAEEEISCGCNFARAVGCAYFCHVRHHSPGKELMTTSYLLGFSRWLGISKAPCSSCSCAPTVSFQDWASIHYIAACREVPPVIQILRASEFGGSERPESAAFPQRLFSITPGPVILGQCYRR